MMHGKTCLIVLVQEGVDVGIGLYWYSLLSFGFELGNLRPKQSFGFRRKTLLLACKRLEVKGMRTFKNLLLDGLIALVL